MSTRHQSYAERALALRFPSDARRLRRLADRAADPTTSMASRSQAIADIGDWLDHAAGHPQMDSPATNLVEALFVSLVEALYPERIQDIRSLWMRES